MPALGIDLCPPEIFIPPGQGPQTPEIWPSVYITPLDQVVSDTMLVDVDDLAMHLEHPGSYTYRATLFWTTERRRTGIQVAVDFTGELKITRYYARDSAHAATMNRQTLTTRGGRAPAVNWLTIDGLLVTEGEGDLKLLIASENDHPVTLEAGSFLVVERRS